MENAERLRARAVRRPLHIVLVEPEIPPNTGNIARLAAATGCPLHLVGVLGFRIDAHAVRRAGLDYWEHVELHQHRTLEEAEANLSWSTEGRGARTYLFSGRAERSFLDVKFGFGDRLVFGKESVGLPDELIGARAEDVVGIPMLGPVRSLNLANAVSIAVYEALRQLGVLAEAARSLNAR
ncbi:MAG: tRNA (cytidine(34)-2'-O)-methyltransferase [Myxococcota bacterium]